MEAIDHRYGPFRLSRAFQRAMTHTATLYALQPGFGEVVVTVHRVAKAGLAAYTGTPGVALAAARTVKGEPKADEFRVADEDGRVVLDYVERPMRG